jgi:two-component system chemotaxis response regulator CheB
MSAAFVAGLAHWLNGTSALPVEVAVDGGQLLPATVSIAPGGGNLIVNSKLTTRCQPPAVGQFHVPGIDHTLTSLAGSRGERVVGVLLTGIGRDGAAGLLALRQRGAVTIGQDEATSAVYGMPAAALALGAVEYQLPLAEIAPVLCRLVLGARSAGRPAAAAAAVGSAAVGSAAIGSASVDSAPVVVPANGSGTAR